MSKKKSYKDACPYCGCEDYEIYADEDGETFSYDPTCECDRCHNTFKVVNKIQFGHIEYESEVKDE